MIFLTGITIIGLDDPLMVGQNATISCMTNVAVDSIAIEWGNQSSVLNMSSADNLTVLDYTIPLVRDDLQGEYLTCTAVAGETTYTETVEIQVTGRYTLYNVYNERHYVHTSPVPTDSLEVETDVSEDGPVEAGSTDLTLTCTVSEVISGLTDMPSAHWSGPVAPVDNIVVTETVRNATTVTVALTFSSLHTSHAGQYTCQGILVSPATEDNIISTSDPVSVTIRCKYSLPTCVY